MPRYFFSIKWPDNEHADVEGTVFQNDYDALEYARRLIRELKEGGAYHDPEVLMIVTDNAGRLVFTLSFSIRVTPLK
jgi:hypothetical protein